MDVVKDRRIPPDQRQRIKEVLRDLARTASIEVTPAQIRTGVALAGEFPTGSHVYVPYLPGAEFGDSVTACRKLITDGMRPVPHLAARAIRSVAELDDWLSALTDTGVDSLLLIAGDRKVVAGPYENTLALLDSGRLIAHGIRRLGVAGHPGGSPVTTPADLENALLRKREYAHATGTDLWIVTQFDFSSRTLITWLRQIRDIVGDVPVYPGIPGPAKLKTLIAYAAMCGVGVSARVLRRRPSAARLLGRWTPDGLVGDLALHAVREPHAAMNGIHVYPFGGIATCAEWLTELARQRSDDRVQENSGNDVSGSECS